MACITHCGKGGMCMATYTLVVVLIICCAFSLIVLKAQPTKFSIKVGCIEIKVSNKEKPNKKKK